MQQPALYASLYRAGCAYILLYVLGSAKINLKIIVFFFR